MYRSWTDEEIKQHLAAQEETNNLLRQLLPFPQSTISLIPDLLNFNKPEEIEVKEPAVLNDDDDDVIRNRPKKRR